MEVDPSGASWPCRTSLRTLCGPGPTLVVPVPHDKMSSFGCLQLTQYNVLYDYQEAVKDVMARAPHMKELIDLHSGPNVVTAKQQEEELQRVTNTLPENIPSSIKRFTDKTLLSLKNSPGWGFDKKCQFMNKFVREVSEQYK
ncbi:hypothetical protein ABZP36_012515 [Zizania latifolia]